MCRFMVGLRGERREMMFVVEEAENSKCKLEVVWIDPRKETRREIGKMIKERKVRSDCKASNIRRTTA